MRAALAWIGVAGLLAGCGAGPPDCTSTGIQVNVGSTSDATPHHRAKSPGNQEQFQAYVAQAFPAGCAVPAILGLAKAQWTSADPINVEISSAQNDTNGLATCLGATDGPVAVTASVTQSGHSASATGSITCR